MPKKYSPKVKFQIVKEVLSTDKSVAQIAREYDVHPNTIHNWKDTFEENGPEVFGSSDEIKEYEKKISDYGSSPFCVVKVNFELTDFFLFLIFL